MRLALFHPAFEAIRGAELLVAAQARHYRSQGLSPHVVTFAWDPGRWGSQLDGIPVVPVPKRHWTDLLLGLGPVAKLRRRGHRAAKALTGFDAIIAHNFPASAMVGAAPIGGRKIWQCNEPPRSLHWRQANPTMTARCDLGGGEPGNDALGAFARNLAAYDGAMEGRSGLWERRAYDLESAAGLDLIYGISQFSRDNARRIYGRCAEEVIYPLVRFPEGGAPARRGLDRSAFRILVHSRLEAMKNIDTVIRGFALFQTASGVPSELRVVGEGPWMQRLASLAGSVCRPGTVVFHGYLPEAELDEVYAACDAFALLPLDEPFGMVFPEAAARGLLLVGPDHGGPLEILDGGRLGWTVDAFSPEALAEALHRIWHLDDAEVDRRRAEADRACRTRFGREVIGPQLMALVSGA